MLPGYFLSLPLHLHSQTYLIFQTNHTVMLAVIHLPGNRTQTPPGVTDLLFIDSCSVSGISGRRHLAIWSSNVSPVYFVSQNRNWWPYLVKLQGWWGGREVGQSSRVLCLHSIFAIHCLSPFASLGQKAFFGPALFAFAALKDNWNTRLPLADFMWDQDNLF